MSIFSTPLDRLTTADLEELLAGGAVENLRLEFKRELPGRDETLKKLTSFANTYGGYLIVGAEASSADGRLVALNGVERQPNYKQTVIQRCAQGSSPLIQPFVSDAIPAPGDPDKVCYVIYVPESDDAPHFINGRKGVYVRTDEYSTLYEPKLAKADELLHLFNRRQLAIERRETLFHRAASRFSHHASANYGNAPTGLVRDRRLAGGPGATMHIGLVPRFPTLPLADIGAVMAFVRDTGLEWRTTGFPADRRPISQHESALIPQDGSDFSLIELNVWGLVSYVVEVQNVWTPDGGGGQISGIRMPSMVGRILAVLEYARRIYDAVGFQGTLQLITTFVRVRGVPMYAFPDGFATVIGQSRFDDEVRFELDIASDRLRTDRDGIARDVLRAALFALGLAQSGQDGVDARTADALISAAYRYNSWDDPAPGDT